MIFFIDDDLTVSGYQSFPHTTKERHLVIEDESVIDQLKDLIGFVKVDHKDQLPVDWLEMALAEKHIDEINIAKNKKILRIKTQCSLAITSGFSSNALGKLHTYPSDRDDQINLAKYVQTGSEVEFKCTDENGVTEFRIHTAAQLKEVLDDGAKFSLAALKRCEVLKQQVQSCLTLEDVDAVTW